jgi:hypothetical protein
LGTRPIQRPVARATFAICGYRVRRGGCLDRGLRLASRLRVRQLLILHTREIAGPAEPRPGEPQRKSGLVPVRRLPRRMSAPTDGPRGTVSTWHPRRRRRLHNTIVSTAVAGRDAPIARRGRRGTPTEHGRAYQPQAAGIGAKPGARCPVETGQIQTICCSHGKEGVVGSSPTEGFQRNARSAQEIRHNGRLVARRPFSLRGRYGGVARLHLSARPRVR